MLQQKDLREFHKKLLEWFGRHRRDLPWRRTKNPYHIWVSEIMLQQTRVAAAIPYYERFLERFPDTQALASAPEEEVLRLWSGLGYYSRARNLQRAAQEIAAKHSGVFPRRHEGVIALSGIGDYTAAAILSIAFGAKHAVLDGNVARVLARIFAVRGGLREGGRWEQLQKAADELLDSQSPGDWNQAMMELGATLCTPRSPQCLLCPAAEFCRGRKLGIAESLPAQRKKRETVEVTLAAGVVLDARGQCLLLGPSRGTGKKAAHDDVETLVSRMWHFPTVAVRKNPEEELKQLLEGGILGKRSSPGALRVEALGRVRHTVTYRKITILPFCVDVKTLPRAPRGEVKAISLQELVTARALAVSNLTRKVALAAAQYRGVAGNAYPASHERKWQRRAPTINGPTARNQGWGARKSSGPGVDLKIKEPRLFEPGATLPTAR